MSSTTANLTNVNFMSKERFDNLSTINDDELYAVKIDNIDNAVSIINQNENENPVKMWTGTRAEYNTLVINDEIDDDTLYNITDDGDVTLNLLQTIYPIGAIYIGTMAICPLSALFGTWELVAGGRVLQGSDATHSAGSTIEAGLPNVTIGNAKIMAWYNDTATWQQGSLKKTDTNNASMASGGFWTNSGVTDFKASHENSIYGNSTTVQPPAFVVNIWKRTA